MEGGNDSLGLPFWNQGKPEQQRTFRRQAARRSLANRVLLRDRNNISEHLQKTPLLVFQLYLECLKLNKS